MKVAKNTYDYIIVGAGSAGCVVAHRLATAGAGSILVLEAGRDVEDEAGVREPMRYGQAFHTDLDWDFWTTPQPQLHNRRIYQPCGKAVGGTSCLHGMAYVRPPLADFDRWRDRGCTGWGSSDVLPFFTRSECMPGSPDFMASHGTAGPQRVSRIDPERASRVAHAFKVACSEAGYKNVADYNDFEASTGVSWLQLYQDAAGLRADAATCYLWPAVEESEALTVVAGSIVDQVLFNLSGPKPRAEGVAYFDTDGGTHHHAYARYRVVLCAGAIGSPAILLRSGIGPRDQLTQLDIKQVSELPGVGKNLQDHIWCPVTFATHEPLALEGLQNHSEVHLLAQSKGACASGGPRDIQVMQTISCASTDQIAINRGGGFTLMPVCLYPKSRGSVTLAAASPFVKEVVDPQYLSNKDDIALLEEAVKLARAIARQPAMRAVCSEAMPGEEVADDDKELRDFILRNASALHHQAGTCRMGSGSQEEDVVDPNLSVIGVDGLMVADASIMPTIVGANTMATCTMIGEKAADLLLMGEKAADLLHPHDSVSHREVARAGA